MKSLILFLLCVVVPLSAESSMSVKLATLAGLSSSEGEGTYTLGQTSGEITIEAVQNKNVKAVVTLEGVSLNSDNEAVSTLTLSRAYIKSRYPGGRLMMGMNHINWSEGTYFNAGDVLFDSTSLTADLTQDEIRDDSLWLMQIIRPLGRFSFVEGVIIPGSLDVDSEDFSYSYPEPDQIKAGGRFYTVLADIKTEGGYVYDGSGDSGEGRHVMYGALQGHLYVDYYGAVSTAAPADDLSGDALFENLFISTGLYHVMDAGYSGTLSLRLESLITPDEEESERLYLYPEAAFSLDSGKAIQLRSLINPLDLSSRSSLIMTWNIYQGFNLISYTTYDSDVSAWSQSFSCRLIF